MRKILIHFYEKKIKGNYFIFIKTEYDKQLHFILMGFGCKFHTDNQEYSIINTPQNYLGLINDLRKDYLLNTESLKRDYLERTINKKPKAQLMDLSEDGQEWYYRFDQYLSVKRYSDQTRMSYLSAVKSLLSYYSNLNPLDIGNEEVNSYIHNYIVPRGYSVSVQRQFISSVKLFFLYANGENMQIDKLELPKKQFSLPRMLSIQEIRKLMERTVNLKHKTILMVLYGTGIRMAELLNLQLKHIDSNQGVIHIIKGKGKKDRNVQLPLILLKQLRIYYLSYRPKVYLFEGASGGKYSSSSVNKSLQRTAKLAGIDKPISAHVIRHSFATHMMEKGVGIRYIQELLGHKSSKTTEIYTHVMQKDIKELSNPLEEFDSFVSESEIKWNKCPDNPLN